MSLSSDRDPVLSVTDLHVAYGSAAVAVPAVNGVSFDIAAGDFVALVGESGSGKSTIANAVIGLLPAATVTSGSIALAGDDGDGPTELLGLGEKAWSRIRGRAIGLVPQDPSTSLNPVLTIGRQVAEVFRLHAPGKPDKAELWRRSVELLDLVGIDRPETRLRQYPHELSGGMRQRVLIAIAFGLHPRLLIADEPTSALDVTVQQQVLEVFDHLADEMGTAVLFVTHDLAVATDHASRVLVMQQGRVVEQGAVDHIVLRSRHDYTRLLLDAATLHTGTPEDEAVPAAPDDEIAVQTRHLTKVFETRGTSGVAVTAVDDVSFAIRRGTTFALVGESGSGKSTTARLILGLVEATSGTVEIGGRALDVSSRRARRELWRDIQYVYQNPGVAFDPRFPVERIIAEPLREFGVGDRASRRARVTELLDQVALPSTLRRRRPRDLSGGQRQRVAIARALALGANIIVLDEAFSALDVVTQAQNLDLLIGLQSDLGLTYLFISHDLAVVQRISDDVGVMSRGRLVETGPTARIFADPREAYTQRLLGSIPGRRFARTGTVADPVAAATAGP